MDICEAEGGKDTRGKDKAEMGFMSVEFSNSHVPTPRWLRTYLRTSVPFQFVPVPIYHPCQKLMSSRI